MPAITDTAICIRRWDYSETSQTVSLFAREHGVMRGIAKGAKREKGAFSGGIDLLTRGCVTALVKSGSELATLTSWHLEEVYRGLRGDLRANRAALYLADLIHHMLREADPHPPLFDAFDTALAAIASHERIELTLLSMQWTVLRETGYQPELDRNADTGAALPRAATLAFSPAAGGVVEAPEADGRQPPWRVRAETIELLRRVAGVRDLKALVTIEAAAETAVRANRLLAAYIRFILGSEPPAMRWAFSDLP